MCGNYYFSNCIFLATFLLAAYGAFDCCLCRILYPLKQGMGGGSLANLLDYLSWRGDVPVFCAPFNDVDNLILSEFSYLSLEHALQEVGK